MQGLHICQSQGGVTGASRRAVYNPGTMVSPPLLDLILYARPGCGLCDEARVTIEALMAARREAGLPTPTLVERDIDTDPAWHDAFFSTIPVVELGDRRIELATSPARLRRLLSETLDGVPA